MKTPALATSLLLLVLYGSADFAWAQQITTPTPDRQTLKEQEKAIKEAEKRRKEEVKKAAAAEVARQKAEAKEKERQAKVERKAQALEDTVPIYVNRTYDRFKNYTLSILNEMPVYTQLLYRPATGNPNFTMAAGIGYQGTSAAPPYEVALGFNIRTTGYTPAWYTGPDLIFIADGERISGFGSTVTWQTYVNWYPILGNVQMIRTYSAVNLRYDDFVKIANSQNVEFRLGGVEATLMKRHLEAFRRLIEQK